MQLIIIHRSELRLQILHPVRQTRTSAHAEYRNFPHSQGKRPGTNNKPVPRNPGTNFEDLRPGSGIFAQRTAFCFDTFETARIGLQGPHIKQSCLTLSVSVGVDLLSPCHAIVMGLMVIAGCHDSIKTQTPNTGRFLSIRSCYCQFAASIR
jgi:hypothetical protein